MKLLRSDESGFRFKISWEEREMLNVLQLYPLVPAAHHRLSKDRMLPNREENQQLLEDALRAQREENRKLVLALLEEPERFVNCGDGYEAGFTRGEIEWLLQVLNDIRVGSWLALGSPDEHPEMKAGISRQAMSRILTMEVAGHFEMCFLGAVGGDLPAGHD